MSKSYLIYATSFFCGMSVMAVELSASRLLAPYFGTSSIIWTIIIGLIMISMSIGNIIGGRSADKYNSMGRLFFLIWIASLWIAAIPLFGKYVVTLSVVVLMWVMPNNLLVAGSVLSCLAIFTFPLVILGMVSPYLVKLGVKSMQDNGKTTGKIYALSTIGSIIGTFVPTFFTIPYIGTGKTFFVFGLLLNLICLAYFSVKKLKTLRHAVSTLIILALVLIPFKNSYAFWTKPVLEDESLYNYLQVSENKDSVVLSTNVAFGVQSIYMKDRTLSGLYYDYALMAPFFMKDTSSNKSFNVLVLGMGTGTYAKECKYFFPDSHIDGVEIDQKIVDLSKKYFELKDNEADIFVNDGRTFLMGSEAGKYDVIMVDAYHDITIPFHMSTTEFFQEVKKHLNPGGVIMININMRSEKSTEIIDYLSETLKSNMNRVYKYNVPYTTNTLVFSSDSEDMAEYLAQNASSLHAEHPLKAIAEEVQNNLTEVKSSAHVLTDDLAPVEVMGQKVLDDIVADSLEDLKKQMGVSGGSLKDILDMVSGG